MAWAACPLAFRGESSRFKVVEGQLWHYWHVVAFGQLGRLVHDSGGFFNRGVRPPWTSALEASMARGHVTMCDVSRHWKPPWEGHDDLHGGGCEAQRAALTAQAKVSSELRWLWLEMLIGCSCQLCAL
jgi:hypothetical protein